MRVTVELPQAGKISFELGKELSALLEQQGETETDRLRRKLELMLRNLLVAIGSSFVYIATDNQDMVFDAINGVLREVIEEVPRGHEAG